MKTIPLTKLKAGISRLRVKGGASPETLFDLLNGYLTTAQSLRSRPGTVKRAGGTLAGTVGLYAFNGSYYVFAGAPQAVPAGFRLGILRHPTNPATALTGVAFKGVIYGRLYVVGRFADGSTPHYWLESDFLPAWKAGAVHQYGDRVVPTTMTGYVYEITNKDMTPAWTANTAYADASAATVQPRAYNGFRYTGVPSQGFPFATGDTEPVWPTTEGGTVTERRYSGFAPATASTDAGATDNDPPEPPPRNPRPGTTEAFQ